MRTSRRQLGIAAAFTAVIAFAILLPPWSEPTSGQALPPLFAGSFAPRAPRPGTPRLTVRSRRANASLKALDAPALSMNLFDNTVMTVTRTKVEHPRTGRMLWQGRGDDGSQVALAVVNGALAGTVYRYGQTFDVVADGDGLY